MYVGNLPWSCTDAELREWFQGAGCEIKFLRMGTDKDGNFRARYRPYLAGAYVLMVKIGRFALQQCPFSVRCSPDVTCAETCEISDFGLCIAVEPADHATRQVRTLPLSF